MVIQAVLEFTELKRTLDQQVMNSFQKFSFDHLPCASLCEGSWNSVQTAIKQRHAPRSCGAQSLVGHFIFQRRWPRPGNRRWPALCAEGNGRPRAG